MKLTIEHLAPYLPYKLRITHWGCLDKIFELNTIVNNSFVGDHSNYEDKYDTKLYLIKPILRPIFDLTKEIEVNGEKFAPIEKLSEWLYNQEPDNFDNIQGVRSWIVAIMRGNDHLNLPYKIVQKLLEWHFDIFYLLDNNLAISYNDINTL